MYWLIIRLFMQSINFLSERLVPLRANPAFKYRELMREKRFSRIDFITLMFFFSSQCFSATSPEKTHLFIGSFWNGFDEVERCFLRWKSDCSFSRSRFFLRSLKCILNFWEKELVAKMMGGCKNEAREMENDDSRSPPKCQGISNMSGTRNGEIDNTIRQWKFNAIAIRRPQTPRRSEHVLQTTHFRGHFQLRFYFREYPSTCETCETRRLQEGGESRCRVRITAGKKFHRMDLKICLHGWGAKYRGLCLCNFKH